MTELSATGAEPAYLNCLALKHLPFSHVMPNGAFYDGSHIKQRRLLLQHLLRATRRPVRLQAVSGAGKTTLITQLQQNASSELRFCAFPLTEDLQQCCRQVLTELGGDGHATESELDLQHYLHQLRRLNIIPVLIVDELESISADARQRLADWLRWQDESEQPLWQAIICAKTAELLTEINFQTLDVPALELAEIAPYLSQRLYAAGYQGELPFNDKTIRRFYRLSTGNPAKLNQLAHQQLLQPVRQRQWLFTVPDFMRHIGRWSAAGAVALVIVVVLIYQQDINQWIASQSVNDETLSMGEDYQPAEVATVIVDDAGHGLDEPQQELAELLAEIPSPLASDDKPYTPIESEPEIIVSEVPVESEPEPQEPVIAVKKDTVMLDSEQEKSFAPVIEKSYGADWILKQNSKNYTFQLMGSWEAVEVDEFIEKYALSGNYARFTSLRDGKPWHVLVYGIYASKQAALKASNQWPAPMNTVPTWLRRFDSVQKQIKEKGVKP
jgi:DamX protein